MRKNCLLSLTLGLSIIGLAACGKTEAATSSSSIEEIKNPSLLQTKEFKTEEKIVNYSETIDGKYLNSYLVDVFNVSSITSTKNYSLEKNTTKDGSYKFDGTFKTKADSYFYDSYTIVSTRTDIINGIGYVQRDIINDTNKVTNEEINTIETNSTDSADAPVVYLSTALLQPYMNSTLVVSKNSENVSDVTFTLVNKDATYSKTSTASLTNNVSSFSLVGLQSDSYTLSVSVNYTVGGQTKKVELSQEFNLEKIEKPELKIGNGIVSKNNDGEYKNVSFTYSFLNETRGYFKLEQIKAYELKNNKETIVASVKNDRLAENNPIFKYLEVGKEYIIKASVYYDLFDGNGKQTIELTTNFTFVQPSEN